MPTYDYLCPTCRVCTEEFFHRPDDAPTTQFCRNCGDRAVRQIGAGGGVIFRGSGFYCTDYKTPKGKVGDANT